MHKIRVRAWDKKNKRMLYLGSLSAVGDFYMTHHQEGIDFYERFMIDYEWMQSTEVIDKNGKTLHDGDIIKFKNKLYHIQWSSLEWRAWSIPHGEWPTLWDFITPQQERSSCEVIGNKYENPELLEK